MGFPDIIIMKTIILVSYIICSANNCFRKVNTVYCEKPKFAVVSCEKTSMNSVTPRYAMNIGHDVFSYIQSKPGELHNKTLITFM